MSVYSFISNRNISFDTWLWLWWLLLMVYPRRLFMTTYSNTWLVVLVLSIKSIVMSCYTILLHKIHAWNSMTCFISSVSYIYIYIYHCKIIIISMIIISVHQCINSYHVLANNNYYILTTTAYTIHRMIRSADIKSLRISCPHQVIIYWYVRIMKG